MIDMGKSKLVCCQIFKSFIFYYITLVLFRKLYRIFGNENDNSVFLKITKKIFFF